GEEAAGGREWQDPFRPAPGRPCCVVLQLLGRVLGNQLRVGEAQQLGPGASSFEALVCELQLSLLKHEAGQLVCRGVQDVELAVLACAKVRELLLRYHGQDSFCVTLLEDWQRQQDEWPAPVLQGGWHRLFTLVESTNRPRLGHMRIIMLTTSLHGGRNGTRAVTPAAVTTTDTLQLLRALSRA
ncbi:hypothetical protein Agub_g1048, partial [Astrephomene gubernaculifera]